MSYAIIRNEKYTKDEMNQLAPHNERYKKKYSNKNIDLSKTSQNYHLKRPIENTFIQYRIKGQCGAWARETRKDKSDRTR